MSRSMRADAEQMFRAVVTNQYLETGETYEVYVGPYATPQSAEVQSRDHQFRNGHYQYCDRARTGKCSSLCQKTVSVRIQATKLVWEDVPEKGSNG